MFISFYTCKALTRWQYEVLNFEFKIVVFIYTY